MSMISANPLASDQLVDGEMIQQHNEFLVQNGTEMIAMELDFQGVLDPGN